MKYGSLFSGIGGFDLGFDRAGMECAWQIEINAAARSVLTRHWPNTEKHRGDVSLIRGLNGPLFSTRDADWWDWPEPVELICGGFPCQDVSVAGQRAGLAGNRSGLWFEFRRILAELKPEWVVVENVPGLLSSNGGRDFATILRGLVELRYGVAWRILDAQHFGVPQRRRRVFIVGHLGDGCAAEVLFERDGSAGNTAARGEAGQEIAATIGASAPGRRNGGSDPTAGHFVTGALNAQAGRHASGNHNEDSFLIASTLTKNHPGASNQWAPLNEAANLQVVNAITSKWAKGTGGPAGDEAQNLIAFEWNRSAGSKRTQIVRTGGSYAQIRPSSIDAIAFTERSRKEGRTFESQEELAYALTDIGSGGNPKSGRLANHTGVRRLTPRECERLQGFPDDHTAGQADSPRYFQLGNAVAVPCAEWIGRRIVAAKEAQ